MRVLFFSYAYPSPWTPGMGTFNRAMLRGLSDQHSVQVVCPVPWSNWLFGRKSKEFTQAVVGIPARYLPFFYPPKILRNRHHQCLELSAGRALRASIRAFKPDVILSYWTYPDGAVATRVAHEAGLPAVAMVGGSDVLVWGRDPARKHCIFPVLEQADGVIAVSDDLRQAVLAGGIPAEKVYVVPRGVDGSMFQPGDRREARHELNLPFDCPVIVSAGRLVPVKGWDVLLRAYELLKQSCPGFKAFIIGSGELRDELGQQIQQLGLAEHVTLLPAKPQAELAKWYQAANLTVLASHSEGIPNVLLESIACGTPFVATDVGGIREIAYRHHDRLVRPNQPAALAAAIDDQLHHQPIFNSGADVASRRFTPLPLPQATALLTAALQHVVYPSEYVPEIDLSRLQGSALADLGLHAPALNGLPSAELSRRSSNEVYRTEAVCR